MTSKELRDAEVALTKWYGFIKPHYPIVNPTCAALRDAADTIDAMHAEFQQLKSHANSFLGYAATVRSENTPEWIEGFLARATRFAHALGENGKFVNENDWITWHDESV